jgi:Zn-dependent M16 (insulinase) family peptidase
MFKAIRLHQPLLFCVVFFLTSFSCFAATPSSSLAGLKKNDTIGDLRVTNLFKDSEGRISAAKLVHIPTGAPVYLLQIETLPQVLTWVDSPVDNERGLPHSLEHLLAGKGTTGRYFELLSDMRLSASSAATWDDFVYYGMSSGTGTNTFFELFHSLLTALYEPDFLDVEAEREFYHFSVSTDQSGKKTLFEGGTVYNEMLSRENRYNYYFQLNKRVFGSQNPYGFESGGFPEEMRGVTPAEIRSFHQKWYRLGPRTGFIFSFPPSQNVPEALQQISLELKRFTHGVSQLPQPSSGPKYPIHPSDQLEPGIYPFPAANNSDPGDVQLAWKPVKASSLLQLKLLELFCHGLGGGENSLLQKVLVDTKTRTTDLAATQVDSYVLRTSGAHFPAAAIDISGIPGNKLTPASLDQIRQLVTGTIKEVSQYSDHSTNLTDFNQSILSFATNRRRAQNVWTRSPPGFDSYPPNTAWKTYLERLEQDPAFVRSLSQDATWQAVIDQLASGKNIWRDLIQDFQLQNPPYITAGIPSRQLQDKLEKLSQERIHNKIASLMEKYGTHDEQEAIGRFEQEEKLKSQEIAKIEEKVSHPRFTERPPLVQDEKIRYQRSQIEGVPVITSLFERPITLDIGLSFDLRTIPARYYKYLPILADCLKSLGLKKDGHVVPYTEFSKRIQREVYAFSTDNDANPVSKRADFTIRASATTMEEFSGALKLISDAMNSNNLDPDNADRLRDILARTVAKDQANARKDAAALSSSYALFYQDDSLFSAIESQFTIAHWNERLYWRLHKPLAASARDALDKFAHGVLTVPACSSQQQLLQSLNQLAGEAPERELVEYWKRNLYSFPETELCQGLQRLTQETMEDLAQGPEPTMGEIRELQHLVLNRSALSVDITASDAALPAIRQNLSGFLKTIPEVSSGRKTGETDDTAMSSIGANLARRFSIANGRPRYVAVLNPDLAGASMAFYSRFFGYSQLDHDSLVRLLASKLFAGGGPHSFFSKAWASGLAYSSGDASSAGLKQLWYNANKSPDISALIKQVNVIASGAPELQDPTLTDYSLAQFFSFSRETLTTAERGEYMARDLRDGNEPEKVRQLSEAILKLRQEPDLLHQLTSAGVSSICGVLIRDECKKEQEAQNSLFFFVGTDQALSGAEKQIPVPDMRRIYPSDFWLN